MRLDAKLRSSGIRRMLAKTCKQQAPGEFGTWGTRGTTLVNLGNLAGSFENIC